MGGGVGNGDNQIERRHLGGEGVHIDHLVDAVVVQHFFPGQAFECIPVLFGVIEVPEESGLLLPACVVIVVGTALGLPIYAAIGGAALVFFWDEGTPVSAVPGRSRATSSIG